MFRVRFLEYRMFNRYFDFRFDISWYNLW